jgi:hypothetical protein
MIAPLSGLGIPMEDPEVLVQAIREVVSAALKQYGVTKSEKVRPLVRLRRKQSPLTRGLEVAIADNEADTCW